MSAMSQIPEHYVTEFGANWEHLLQQKVSRLESYVTVDVVHGKEKTYNQLAETTMRLITTRAGETIPQDTATAKRWLREKGYDSVTLFDEFDELLLGNVVLPKSETIANHAMAYKRTCDQVLIAALGGTAYTGEDGTTPTVLPSSQEVDVNWKGPGVTPANVGLNLAKLIEARSILGKNEVDEEDQLIIVVSQQQLDDMLLSVDQVSNADYSNVQALVSGKVDTFMGFKFVKTQLLPLDANTDVRTCFAYAKSGVILGDGGRKAHMDIRPDKSHALQIRTVARLGATRREEEKVVKIFCDESPAA